MGTIKIEVSSDREALEYCELHNYNYLGAEYDESKIYLLANEKTCEFESIGNNNFEVHHEGGYIIYAIVGRGCPLYVADRGKEHKEVTFKLQNAKLFSHDEARLKAHCMTITGRNRHTWRIRKI